MIRCEHCGSALPDGAIFCGECGRAVTASASRIPAASAPVEQAPPPPLLQPDVHGRRPDPAADAWLPEATLDPATRAWLTGSDHHYEQPPAPSPGQHPGAPASRSELRDPDGADAEPARWTPTPGGARNEEPPPHEPLAEYPKVQCIVRCIVIYAKVLINSKLNGLWISPHHPKSN